MRVRGLKHVVIILIWLSKVAPHAGAWIETMTAKSDAERKKSHPMRVRGLKLQADAPISPDMLSHPMRVRGLKRKGFWNQQKEQPVAPHAGAWIETPSKS